jgi:hemolysin III
MKSIARIKEPFCGLSHGFGVVLSVAALIALLVVARGRFWHTAGFAIYGASLILLYSASTLYHSLDGPPYFVQRLMRLDHSAIFGLIAGSYTPICLISMRNELGWTLLLSVYSLAAAGIALTLRWKNGPDWPRVSLYIILGWLSVLAFAPLRDALTPEGMAWLVAGGVVYSVGTIIFATDRPHLWPGKFSAHDLWHLFVLGGSACHFVVMLRYVARTA